MEKTHKTMLAEGFSGLKAFFFRTRKMKLFFVWFIFIVFLLSVWIVAGNNNDRTVGVSALVCGGSTFLFWNCRKTLSEKYVIRWSPRKEFIFLGSLGAAWVEFVFWFLEKSFGASGVAASPNLVIDLLATMPWYVMMLFLLYRVETTYHYSYTEILLLGGIYELGADGIFGQIQELTMPSILLTVSVIPLFVIVYSFIVLPPTYFLRKEIAAVRTLSSEEHRYWYALLPLLGLVPYFSIVFLVFL